MFFARKQKLQDSLFSPCLTYHQFVFSILGHLVDFFTDFDVMYNTFYFSAWFWFGCRRSSWNMERTCGQKGSTQDARKGYQKTGCYIRYVASVSFYVLTWVCNNLHNRFLNILAFESKRFSSFKLKNYNHVVIFYFQN